MMKMDFGPIILPRSEVLLLQQVMKMDLFVETMAALYSSTVYHERMKYVYKITKMKDLLLYKFWKSSHLEERLMFEIRGNPNTVRCIRVPI